MAIGHIGILINHTGVLYLVPLLDDPQHFEEALSATFRDPSHLILVV